MRPAPNETARQVTPVRHHARYVRSLARYVRRVASSAIDLRDSLATVEPLPRLASIWVEHHREAAGPPPPHAWAPPPHRTPPRKAHARYRRHCSDPAGPQARRRPLRLRPLEGPARAPRLAGARRRGGDGHLPPPEARQAGRRARARRAARAVQP